MSNSLQQQLQDDMKAALKAGEKERLGTIRMLIAAVKQREIDEKITLDDPAILKVVEKMIKQRRESIRQYETGNRPDLAAKEQSEIDLLSTYMPAALSDEEINTAIATAIQSANATSMKDMGKVMGALQSQLQGRADMSAVSAKVKEQLA